MGTGRVLGWVPGIAPPGPTRPPTTPGTPPPRHRTGTGEQRVCGPEEYGRGAHIRRPTLFMAPDLRVLGYYREL